MEKSNIAAFCFPHQTVEKFESETYLFRRRKNFHMQFFWQLRTLLICANAQPLKLFFCHKFPPLMMKVNFLFCCFNWLACRPKELDCIAKPLLFWESHPFFSSKQRLSIFPLKKGGDNDEEMVCGDEGHEGFGKESEAFGDAFLKDTGFHTRRLITNR